MTKVKSHNPDMAYFSNLLVPCNLHHGHLKTRHPLSHLCPSQCHLHGINFYTLSTWKTHLRLCKRSTTIGRSIREQARGLSSPVWPSLESMRLFFPPSTPQPHQRGPGQGRPLQAFGEVQLPPSPLLLWAKETLVFYPTPHKHTHTYNPRGGRCSANLGTGCANQARWDPEGKH